MTPTAPTERLARVIISPEASIAEALVRLDQAGTGALVLCSDGRRLVGLLTDGDIRRAILAARQMDEPCGLIGNRQPITAREPVVPAEALRLMNRRDINHLPVVDSKGVLCDFILRRDLAAATGPSAPAQERLASVLIQPSQSIADAIARLDQAGTGALLLCTEDRKVRGLLTDGDVRRSILRRVSMADPCESIASHNPVVAPGQLSHAEALRLMDQHDVNHLPVLDADGRVVEFLLRKDLVEDPRMDLSAVIMAGGFGKRLLPLTERVPKPMLPVGDRPLLELTIEQLRRAGIQNVNLTTHYLPDSIVNHFGDGGGFGVNLNYLQEDHPMGTAGGLRQMKRPEGPFLVINGDILTGVPFQEMLAFHRKYGSALTVGVRKYDVQVPFGVVECEDVRIIRLQEKPSLGFFINAGTYLLDPVAWDHIPEGRTFDMTDLIQKLLEVGQPVVSFPIMEYWLDVGRPEDYQRAQEDVRKGKI